MRLRNKKTGEIRTAYVQVILENNHPEKPEKPLEFHTQRSIAELNDEWEDYEEPKKYWYIGDRGEIFPEIVENPGHIWHQARKEIGNYFETEEEAEKAVERLKAWERLQKKFDLHITGWDVLDNQVIITTDCDFDYVRDRQDDGLWADLDLLFNGNLIIGGEE